MAAITDKTLRNKVVYSVYVRNHSKEGSFKAVEQDLERIRRLGVDIVWLLPIHPIGELARKGEWGSPYANRDYREINPELGTLDDFKSLVASIHRHGMKCIIDVVYNHTSPDSRLAEQHPEFFYRTSEGKMGNRVGEWGDIVDLDYSVAELWDYQIETLKMWAAIVDGFRCDVAPLLPLEFWLRARREVAGFNPDCLWLSESIEPAFIMDLRARGLTALSDSEILQAFDVSYDYDVYPYFRGYLDGSNSLGDYIEKINRQEFIYPDNYVKLRFLENHDRPRAKALFPNEADLINWTAFMYFQKGMPLIYAGQEAESANCPDLFNKDGVNWHSGSDLSWLFQALYSIKQREIMAYGLCRFTALDEEDMVVGAHTWGEQKLVGVFSLKGNPSGDFASSANSANSANPAGGVDVGSDLADGVYANLIDGGSVTVEHGRLYSEAYPVIVEKQ